MSSLHSWAAGLCRSAFGSLVPPRKSSNTVPNLTTKTSRYLFLSNTKGWRIETTLFIDTICTYQLLTIKEKPELISYSYELQTQKPIAGHIMKDFQISDFQIYYSCALFTKIITLTALHQLHQLKRENKYYISLIHSQTKMCSVTKVA